MRFFVMLSILASMSSFSAYAESIDCRSKSYRVIVEDGRANYSIRSYLNVGAEVELSQKLQTKNIIAISLTVDSQINKFEVTATKISKGVYKGTLFADDLAQAVVCKVQ